MSAERFTPDTLIVRRMQEAFLAIRDFFRVIFRLGLLSLLELILYWRANLLAV